MHLLKLSKRIILLQKLFSFSFGGQAYARSAAHIETPVGYYPYLLSSTDVFVMSISIFSFCAILGILLDQKMKANKFKNIALILSILFLCGSMPFSIRAIFCCMDAGGFGFGWMEFDNIFRILLLITFVLMLVAFVNIFVCIKKKEKLMNNDELRLKMDKSIKCTEMILLSLVIFLLLPLVITWIFSALG